jgi:MFS family permease
MRNVMRSWIFLILFHSALLQSSIYVIRPMITYRGLELNATASTIGVIGAIYALLPVILAVFFGRSVEIIGEKKFLILGSVGILISALFLAQAKTVLVLAVFTACAGVAHLAVMVGGQTIVSKKSMQASYDKNFGLYTFSASLGHMIGPILGGIAAGSNGSLAKSTSNAFFLAACLAVIGVIPILFAKRDLINHSHERKESVEKVLVSRILSNKDIRAAIITSLIISSVSDILVVFLPLLGQAKNYTPFQVGLLLSLRAGMAMLSRLFLGNLSKTFTARNVMILSGLVSTISCGLLFTTSNLFMTAVTISIVGFSLGIGQPLTMAWVSRSSQLNERAMAISLRLTGNRLGQFVFPLIAGLTAGSLGIGSVFLVMSATLGVATLVTVRDYQVEKNS